MMNIDIHSRRVMEMEEGLRNAEKDNTIGLFVLISLTIPLRVLSSMDIGNNLTATLQIYESFA